jgi:hypothetical protein
MPTNIKLQINQAYCIVFTLLNHLSKGGQATPTSSALVISARETPRISRSFFSACPRIFSMTYCMHNKFSSQYFF